jgi:hypothetical protein
MTFETDSKRNSIPPMIVVFKNSFIESLLALSCYFAIVVIGFSEKECLEKSDNVWRAIISSSSVGTT